MVAEEEQTGLDFGIGSDVSCDEGPCGRLAMVVVDPDSDEVTDLIVERGVLLRTDRVVPVSMVSSTGAGSIELEATLADLEACPEFHEHHFMTPGGGEGPVGYAESEMRFWRTPYGAISAMKPVAMIEHRVLEGIDADLEVIGRGTPVLTLEHKRVGKVDHVLANAETEDMTHIVVRRGLLPDYRIMPVDRIDSVAEEGIYLKPGYEKLDALPHYRPQAPELTEAELLSQLAEEDFDTSALTASMASGILTLTGVVESPQVKRRAEDAARATSGVVHVENALDTDTEIRSRVVAALQEDATTESAVIDVVSERGQVTLSGKVDTEAIKSHAEDVAAGQRGVNSVINGLVVDAEDQAPRLLPFPPNVRGPGHPV